MQFGGIRTSGAAALRHFSGQDWNHDVCIYRFNYYLRDQMSISIFFFFFGSRGKYHSNAYVI